MPLTLLCPACCRSRPHRRHTRQRPGFLVQYLYDVEKERVMELGSKVAAKRCPELTREASRSCVPDCGGVAPSCRAP